MPCAPPLSSVHVPHLHHAPTCGLFVPTPYSYKATTRSPPPPPTTMAIQVSSPFQNDLRAGKETPFPSKQKCPHSRTPWPPHLDLHTHASTSTHTQTLAHSLRPAHSDFHTHAITYRRKLPPPSEDALRARRLLRKKPLLPRRRLSRRLARKPRSRLASVDVPPRPRPPPLRFRLPR